MAPTEQQRLGHAIDEAREAAGITKGQLAAEIGNRERGRPYTPSMVTEWIDGHKTMRPAQVMAAENALGLRPGTLTQHLGYLPVGSVAVVDVEEAIARDLGLTPRQRDELCATYRAFIAATEQARERRR